MDAYKHKLALLADQPHEAQFIAPLANTLLDLNRNIHFSLAFTDYYTFLSRTDFLRGLQAGFPGQIEHLARVYQGWQEAEGEPFVDFDFLEQWERENCSQRTLEEIEKTNQLVFADERLQWHFPISDLWKKRILVDTIKWCEDYLENFRPTCFLSVGNATLATNVLYTLASKRKIPFFTLFPSRIGNRILLRDDFAYGVSEKLYKEIILLAQDKVLMGKAESFAIEFRTQKKGIYESFQNKVSEDLLLKRSQILKSFFLDLRIFLGRIYARVFIFKRLYAFPVRRINEDFLRMSFHDLRRLLSQYLHLAGIFVYGITEPPKVKYILWALHMRPEGAVSTLGDGHDEISELLRCTELLPNGYFMAVKENSEMFGQRKPGFHRKLKKNPKIILVDPNVSILPLIESSIGVMGISGTVLLEAAILNKPSCGLGHPEFDKFLTDYGWDSAENFIEKCVSGLEVAALDKILPYLSYVLENTDARDTPPWHDWLGEFGKNEIKETHKRLAQKLTTKLKTPQA